MEYFKLCLSEYGKSLHTLGSNLQEFFSNLDGLHELIKTSGKFSFRTLPSFRPEYNDGQMLLHLYTERRDLVNFMCGLVHASAELMFSCDVAIRASLSDVPGSIHHILTIKNCNNDDRNGRLWTHLPSISNKPADSKISVVTFCQSFPFHVIFDRSLQIAQLGAALMKMIAPDIATKGIEFGTYFDIVRPVVKLNFSSILSRVNSSFILNTKSLTRGQTLAQVRAIVSI